MAADGRSRYEGGPRPSQTIPLKSTLAWAVALRGTDAALQDSASRMDPLQLLLGAAGDARAPEGVETRIIAIDGPGGAGKTTLAAWLEAELHATAVIHTDDFASWDNPINWWPALVEQALKPLAAGAVARYQPTAWGGEERTPIVIEPGGTVLLEGVSAARSAFRPYLAYAVWVETDRAVRLQRGIDRDGEDARAQWGRWMAGEDDYIARERPAEHVDLVLPGDQGLWTTRTASRWGSSQIPGTRATEPIHIQTADEASAHLIESIHDDGTATVRDSTTGQVTTVRLGLYLISGNLWALLAVGPVRASGRLNPWQLPHRRGN
jgi:uridine kinase